MYFVTPLYHITLGKWKSVHNNLWRIVPIAKNALMVLLSETKLLAAVEIIVVPVLNFGTVSNPKEFESCDEGLLFEHVR